MKLNSKILKLVLSVVLAFSLLADNSWGVKGIVPYEEKTLKGYYFDAEKCEEPLDENDEKTKDAIEQEEQPLKDNELCFSKENSEAENEEPKDLYCDAEDLGKVDRVERYMNDNCNFFPKENRVWLEEKLSKVADKTLFRVFKLKLKNPYSVLANTVFFGWTGIDRFSIESFGLGIAKVAISALIFARTMNLPVDEFLMVFFGITTFEPFNLFDMINIMEETRQYNFNKVMDVIREDF